MLSRKLRNPFTQFPQIEGGACFVRLSLKTKSCQRGKKQKLLMKEKLEIEAAADRVKCQLMCLSSSGHINFLVTPSINSASLLNYSRYSKRGKLLLDAPNTVV